MLPIPLMKGSLGCLNTVSYPLGVSPSLWYDAAAPTASISTTGSNVINSSSKYSEWFDFGTKKYNLNTEGGSSLRFYDYDNVNGLKNSNTYFESSYPSTANNIYRTGNSFGISGQGTVAVVMKYGRTNPPGSLSAYVFTTKAASPNTYNYGFVMADYDLNSPYTNPKSYVTIFGDNQSYRFDNMIDGEWHIQIVSVTSPGNPAYYKTNGVIGATTSYTTNPVGGGPTAQVGFTSNYATSIAEFLYFETPLTNTQCEDLEAYLKQKWCLEF